MGRRNIRFENLGQKRKSEWQNAMPRSRDLDPLEFGTNATFDPATIQSSMAVPESRVTST